MIAIALVVFREALEISLILGILLAGTRGIASRLRYIWTGFLAGILGSFWIAASAAVIADAFEGIGQELMNAAVLLLGGSLIGWTVIWMEKHGKEFSIKINNTAAEIKNLKKPLITIALIVALAVLREGAEIVLFLAGFLSNDSAPEEVITGLAVGLFSGFMFGAVLYKGLIRISPAFLFKTTSVLLVFLAAGMIGQGFHWLSVSGTVPSLGETLWDSSGLLPEESWPGRLAKGLAGYTARPAGIQVLAWLLSFLAIGFLTWLPGLLKFIRSKSHAANSRQLVLLLILFSSLSSEKIFGQKLYSPHVTDREIELELRSEFPFQDWQSFGLPQKHKIALGASLNQFWFTELYGIMQWDTDGRYSFKAVEWANKLMLTEPGESFIDWGIYGAFEHTLDNTESEAFEIKLLMEKETGKLTHRLVPQFNLEFGGATPPGYAAKLGAGSYFRIHPSFEPGYEFYADFGEFNDAQLLLGPVIYGKLGSFKYDLGFLFTLNKTSNPDNYFKLNMEYEFYY